MDVEIEEESVKIEDHSCSAMRLQGYQNDFVSIQPVHETTTMDDEIHSKQQLLGFPHDLMVDILVRIPVRSLLQLKCVCKSWNTLISDPQFAKHQIQTSTANPNMTYKRLVSSVINERWKIIYWPLKSHFEKPSTSTKPFCFRNDQSYRILGSCSGLICLYAISRGYIQLWNPLTNLKSNRSPTVLGNLTYHGFGYDHVSDKYKVLVVMDYLKEVVTEVYTFGETENRWRSIQKFPYTLFWSSGKFVNNTLNWLAKDAVSPYKWVIFSFDLEKETHREVLLPKKPDGKNIFDIVLDVWNYSLCVCFGSYETGGELWLMKEYGVVESWAKLMVVNPYQKLIFSEPLCISEHGIVLRRNFCFSEMLLYEAKTNMLCFPMILRRLGLDYNIYHESLVSPRF